MLLKRTEWRHGSVSTVATVWHRLTAEEAEVGLMTADVLPVRRWWLKERQLVLVCQLLKMAVVC